MNYDPVDAWNHYTFKAEDGHSYEIFESIEEPEYTHKKKSALKRLKLKPALNLEADQGTLNCLKWLLVDQKDVELEVKRITRNLTIHMTDYPTAFR